MKCTDTEHAVVPLCSVSYLDENHAMKFGMQTAADCDLDCYACKEWLSEEDPLHEEPNLGCQAKERNVISEYISEAKEYVDDAIVKMYF